MFRFARLFGDQYLGFWIIGLLLFAVQEIPYMLMPIFKLGNDPIMHMQESSKSLDTAEKILGSLCIALMTMIVRGDAGILSLSDGKEKLFFGLSMLVLILNFAGWGIYFMGHQTMFVMMFFIVVLPPLYYVFIGLWRGNPLLSVTGGIFLIVHFIHVRNNLLLTTG